MTKKTAKKGGKRVGEVRCLNCFARFLPAHGVQKASCPECSWEWHISWSGKLAKIRKPIWESWERQLAEEKREE